MSSLFRKSAWWTSILFEQLGQDTRYALRALRRSPRFAIAATLTLALGIGGNTAIFSVINAVILRPLPYRDPGNLVLIDTSPINRAPSWLTAAWRDRAKSLAQLAGFNGPRPATLVHAGTSQQVDVANVTWNFFSFLGIKPVIGRDFTAADADASASVGAIVSDELWKRSFASDPAVVGRTLRVTGTPVTIIGVAPPGFRFPAPGALPAARMPQDTQPDILLIARPAAELSVIGRLSRGSSPTMATTELLAIFKQEAVREYRRELIDRLELHATPLQERLVGNVAERLWLVTGAVAFLLLIACANVANLLLARASTRQREIGLRIALGASKARLVRLLLTESVILALFGSIIALALAYMTMGAARALLADRVPHVNAIAIDSLVFTFNVAVAAVSGIICGLLSLSGIEGLNTAALSDSSSYAVTGRNSIRRVILAAETAITFVLFVGAVLLAETLWNLSVQNRGFDADGVLTLRIAPILPSDVNRSDPRWRPKFFAPYFTDLRQRLERVPGVVSAAAVSLGPLEGISGGFSNVAVNGRTSPSGVFTPVAFVTPGYFKTMRIAILEGRDFSDTDRSGATLVAVVNQAFQRQFAPDGNIIGAQITTGSGPERFAIVGMTQDVPDRSLRERSQPLLIAPLAQMPDIHLSWVALTFVLRTVDRDPLRIAAEVRRTVWAVNPDIVITDIASMNTRVGIGMRAERDSALLFGLLGFTALAMATLGVYGVATYAITQRMKEIGIRIALGATRYDVRRLIISQTAWPTLAGIAAGVVAAAMLTRLVTSMVYGVAPLDPAAFGIGVTVLGGVALATSWIAARRAIQIDPIVALKSE